MPKIMNKQGDHKYKEKDLLLGRYNYECLSNESFGYETTVSIIIDPVGSYYYSWESGRWKSNTKHVFEITAFKDLGNNLVEVVDSFTSNEENNSFEIFSSRKDLNKRKFDTEDLNFIKNDLNSLDSSRKYPKDSIDRKCNRSITELLSSNKKSSICNSSLPFHISRKYSFISKNRATILINRKCLERTANGFL